MTSIEVDRAVRADVAEVLVRYATGIDRRDWELFRTCFTDDCEADYGAIGVWDGAEAITAWMRETHAPCGLTLHRISNEAVEPHDEGVSSRCYVDALIMGPDNTAGVQALGYYDDVLVRRADGWKIARRRFTQVCVRSVTSEGRR
jgi:3-phenylpropionate/cinnamic acid dioxygenase small subunit